MRIFLMTAMLFVATVCTSDDRASDQPSASVSAASVSTAPLSAKRLTMPIFGRGMQCSPSGRFAVVWGPGFEANSGHVGNRDINSLWVFDTETESVLGTRELSGKITSVVVAEDAVVVGIEETNILSRFDLALKTRRRFIAKSTAFREARFLFRSGAKQLTISGQLDNGLQMLSIDTMKRIDQTPIPLIGFPKRISHRYTYFNDRLYDTDSGTVARYHSLKNLPSLIDDKNPAMQNARPRVTPPSLWDRVLGSKQVNDTTGQPIRQWELSSPGVFGDVLPLVLKIEPPDRKNQRRMKVDIAWMADGSTIGEHRFEASDQSYRRMHPGSIMRDHQAAMIGRKFRCVCDRAFVYGQLSDQTVAKMAKYPVFETTQETQIDLTQSPQIKLAVRDLDSVADAFLNPVILLAGMKFDSPSGTLTLDAAKLWREFTKRNPNLSVADNAAQYRAITGKELPADRLATVLPILASIETPDRRLALTRFEVIVLGDRAAIR